ncbi:hypothetical protein GOP47_0016309 [Adiantum capillus-veneris]|uniref:Uncharacterized protein n=1 Tax=Adiantum capillus-veneris TaxID=13818 RepID=A0A9D4UI98_ADICA|nr:hypothetical protein GOP47_0016309 [Adiantum capillus-veneris]
MALMAVLEADLRALSLEARRKYPALKEDAEHAILIKLRSLPYPTLLARSDDNVRIFIMYGIHGQANEWNASKQEETCDIVTGGGGLAARDLVSWGLKSVTV